MGYTRNYVKWALNKSKLPDYKIEFVSEGISDKDDGEYKSLAYHYKKYDLANKKIILKIDVDGAEYPVLNDPLVYSLFGNAVQLVLEFHDLSKNMADLLKIMNNLSKTHSLIHIHANNFTGVFDYEGKIVPETIEATFLLNKYVPKKEYTTTAYPVAGLDAPCNKREADTVLDFFL